MTRRRLFLFFSLLILLLGLAAGLSLYWLGPGPSVITQEAANIIRPGMTVSDVESILGGPARDETTALQELHRELPLLKPGAESRAWLSDLAWVRVEFDQVVGTVSTAAAQQKTRETALDTLRRFLGL
jgi:hypothetical protein